MEGFLPILSQPEHSRLLFTTLKTQHSNQQSDFISLGLGLRSITSPQLGLGIHFALERTWTRKSAFYLADTSLEMLGQRFNFQINHYLPLGDRRHEGGTWIAPNTVHFIEHRHLVSWTQGTALPIVTDYQKSFQEKANIWFFSSQNQQAPTATITTKQCTAENPGSAQQFNTQTLQTIDTLSPSATIYLATGSDAYASNLNHGVIQLQAGQSLSGRSPDFKYLAQMNTLPVLHNPLNLLGANQVKAIEISSTPQHIIRQGVVIESTAFNV